MDFTKLKKYIDSLHNDKGVPACGVSVFHEHAEVFRHTCGYSDYENTIPLRTDDQFFMYSCTKPVTAAAGVRLIEDGKLNLDAPVSDYLPCFNNVFLVKEGKHVSPRRAATVRNLFTMSAGFDYNLYKEPVREVLSRRGSEASTREIAEAITLSPLSFEPGGKFQYSLCHDILAAVIETAAGMSFGEYLKQIIFEPLEMNNTYFATTREYPELTAKYMYDEANSTLKTAPRKNMFIPSDRYESGGAGLISTQEDYGRFADALANDGTGINGNHILTKAGIDMLRTEQLRHHVADPVFSCAAGPGYGYGLGVRTLVDKSFGARSALGEFGWDGAAGSYLMADPENRLACVTMMHIRGWTTMLGSPHIPVRDLLYDCMEL